MKKIIKRISITWLFVIGLLMLGSCVLGDLGDSFKAEFDFENSYAATNDASIVPTSMLSNSFVEGISGYHAVSFNYGYLHYDGYNILSSRDGQTIAFWLKCNGTYGCGRWHFSQWSNTGKPGNYESIWDTVANWVRIGGEGHADGVNYINASLTGWEHLIFVRSPGTAKIYHNGVLKAQANVIYNPEVPYPYFAIGNCGYNPSGRLSLGTYDLFQFWDRALYDGNCQINTRCEGEIATLFNNGNVLTYPFYTVKSVDIDIKPQQELNKINICSTGMFPVAILSTEDFDAATVDISTVRLGLAVTHHAKHIQDVDKDGDSDLVLFFNTKETGIGCDSVSATLTGTTLEGQDIEGYDVLDIIKCKKICG